MTTFTKMTLYVTFANAFLSLIMFTSASDLLDTRNTPTGISSWNVCHRSQPNFNECIKSKIMDLKPILKQGSEELGIPSCEPIIIKEMTISNDPGSVSIESTYTNINAWGATDYTVKEINIDRNLENGRLVLLFPELKLQAQYSLNGRVLTMMVKGNGTCYGNYTNVLSTIDMQFEKVVKNGEEYLNCKDMKVDIKIGKAHFRMDDLFKDNKQMSNTANLLLNNNWAAVAEEVKPVLQRVISKMLKQWFNSTFGRYKLNDVMPE